jgi:hypothetical protein
MSKLVANGYSSKTGKILRSVATHLLSQSLAEICNNGISNIE